MSVLAVKFLHPLLVVSCVGTLRSLVCVCAVICDQIISALDVGNTAALAAAAACNGAGGGGEVAAARLAC
jgi:hypothetical protein